MSEYSQPFSDMADRIERLAAGEFAGAVVIVPPEGGVIAFVLSDPTPSLPMFWAGVEGRVQVAAAEAQDAQKQTAPWGR